MIDFQNNGDGTATLTLSFTNDLPKIAKAAEYAAKDIFGGDSRWEVDETLDNVDAVEVFFDDLTNAEKLDILNDWVRDTIVEKARAQIRAEKFKQADIDAENDDTIIV